MKLLNTCILFVALNSLLIGCKPNIEDAKKLGFESVEEMERFKFRGYRSMAEYKKVKEFTAQYFYNNCEKANSESYNSKCLGRRISWFGVVNSVTESNVANIKILDDNLKPIESGFDIDSKSLGQNLKSSDVNKIIEFDGVIKSQNFMTPDIEETIIVKLESEQDKNSRIESQKKQNDKIEKEEYANNSSNSKWLDEKYGVAGPLACSSNSDDYLRTASKYSFKWDEMGFLSVKFDQYLLDVVTPGVITYSSNKVSLQNGFGAFVRVTLMCDYDTQQKKVLRYEIIQ
jgi:hypothetical protein